jgi:hypothetical protein
MTAIPGAAGAGIVPAAAHFDHAGPGARNNRVRATKRPGITMMPGLRWIH